MVIQNIKKLILSASLVLFFVFSFGQKSPFIIVSDIEKNCFYPGDTLSFTIKNKIPKILGYTIEAVCVDTNSNSITFYSEVYTSYFNKDTAFFRKLNANIKLSKKNNLHFIMPDVHLNPQTIQANSVSTFLFVLKGNIIKKGIKVKLLIIPSLIDEGPNVIIETKPFYIFAKAM